jgi:hypothetical protein
MNFKTSLRQISESFLGSTLVPNQEEVFKNVWTKRISVITAHTGWGRTFSIAHLALLNAWLLPGRRIGCFSPSWGQSKLIYDEIMKILPNAPIIEAAIDEIYWDTSTWRIRFHASKSYNPSVIQSFSVSDASRIKGARYHTILIDEAANIPEEVFSAVIRPMNAVHTDPVSAMRLSKEKDLVMNLVYLPVIKKFNILDDMDQHYKMSTVPNQLVLFTTAYYTFNWLYKLIKLYEQSDDCYVGSFPLSSTPLGFVDMMQVTDAKRDMPADRFAMKYSARWVDADRRFKE